ncbi:hypothetical protein BJ994_001704 [Arthrobacter pigmenti]|uniref:Uncharacterized protein n=1 Tax=Arthrobacter pigmenti TaxID=271432 RepID=A0A846RHA5_9MICC|nr:hypothetical protein [Arthrobacter pigmenti]NJC22628.1 hypothetical protein [Arthrobacter pigmenti]
MKFKIVNFHAHRISGWVYEPDADQGNVVLDLMINGETVSVLSCNIFRDELSTEEFSTRNVGFLGNLPPQFWTGEEYDVALIHRGTGDVLTQKRLRTVDSRVEGTEDLHADFMVTSRGQVLGWASTNNRPACARVIVDGKVIDQAQTDRRVLPWKRETVKFNGPVGYMYGAQIHSEFFDGRVHRVQILAGSEPHASVSVFDQTLALAEMHRHAAEREAQRLVQSARETASTWLKQARVRTEICVAHVELTKCYASVTLTGQTQHRRLVLRLGKTEVILSALTEQLEGVPEAAGTARYACEIPFESRFTDPMRLFTPGAEFGNTFDLRLGDATGRRPAGLPETVNQVDGGEFLLSATVLDGGAFTGWAFHTADLDSPVELVLREVVESGEVDIQRSSAVLKNSDSKSKHGIRHAGYALALPSSVLERRTAHLRLVALHPRGEERMLWENKAFLAADSLLLGQALREEERMADLASLIHAGMEKVASVIESNKGYDHILGSRLDKPEYARIASNSAGLLCDGDELQALFRKRVKTYRQRVCVLPEEVAKNKIICYASTSNNRREVAHLSKMLKKQMLDDSIPNLCDYTQRKSNRELPRVREAITAAFGQFLARREGISRGLLHQLLNYGGFFLTAYEVLEGSACGTFVVANDHSPAPVAYAKAAAHFNKRVVYVQHAEVTANFPALDFDLSILRNKASLRTYREIGRISGETLISARGDMMARSALVESTRNELKKRAQLPALIYPTSVSSTTEILRLYQSLASHPAVSEIAVKLHPSAKNDDIYRDHGMRIMRDTPTYAHLAVCGNSSVAVELLATGSLVYQCFDIDQIAPDYYGFVSQGLVGSVSIADIAEGAWRPGQDLPVQIPLLDDFIPNPDSVDGIVEHLKTPRLLLQNCTGSSLEVGVERRMREEERLLRDLFCSPAAFSPESEKRTFVTYDYDDWWVIGVLNAAFDRREVYLDSAYGAVDVNSAHSTIGFWLAAKTIEWTGRIPTSVGLDSLAEFVDQYNRNVRARKWLEAKLFDLIIRFGEPPQLIRFLSRARYVSKTTLTANKNVAFYRYMKRHPEWKEELRKLYDPEFADLASLDKLKISVQGLREIDGRLEYSKFQDVEKVFLESHPIIADEYNKYVVSTYKLLGERVRFIDVERNEQERQAVFNLIRDRISTRTGFAFIRLSDGEGIIFKDDSNFFSLSDIANRQRHWWGQEIPQDILDELIRDLQASVRSSDLLGIPSVYRFVRDHSHRTTSLGQTLQGRGLLSVLQGLSQYDDPGKLYTDDKANIVLFTDPDNIHKLARAANKLVVVSSGSPDSVDSMFGRDGYRMIHIAVPTHNKTRTNPKYHSDGRPLPFTYRAVNSRLTEVVEPGDLVLVGAGVAGKVFVATAKKAGAVGLDIGSAMDQLLDAGIHSLF